MFFKGTRPYRNCRGSKTKHNQNRRGNFNNVSAIVERPIEEHIRGVARPGNCKEKDNEDRKQTNRNQKKTPNVAIRACPAVKYGPRNHQIMGKRVVGSSTSKYYGNMQIFLRFLWNHLPPKLLKKYSKRLWLFLTGNFIRAIYRPNSVNLGRRIDGRTASIPVRSGFQPADGRIQRKIGGQFIPKSP